jgi:hypothetical protein
MAEHGYHCQRRVEITINHKLLKRLVAGEFMLGAGAGRVLAGKHPGSVHEVY